MEFSDLQKMVHETAKSKGWHDRIRSAPEFLLLLHTEISEATEALRMAPEGKLYSQMVDFCEELADLAIRLLDFCEFVGINLESHIMMKDQYNRTRSYRHGNKAF